MAQPDHPSSEIAAAEVTVPNGLGLQQIVRISSLAKGRETSLVGAFGRDTAWTLEHEANAALPNRGNGPAGIS